MCRLLAWSGEPVTLQWLLWDRPHSLERQSWQPREQRHGTINADGWGVGWFEPAERPEPARYRSPRPMWADASFRSVAGVVRSARGVLAAVRSATPPAPVEESNAPPFTAGRWLFAHNGAVAGWRDGVGEALRRSVTERRASSITGSTDSEVLFALALDQLDQGASLGAALSSVVEQVTALAEARLNLVVTDGDGLAATTWGDTLGWCAVDGPAGVLVASEPPDDRAALGDTWHDVPDRHLLTLDPTAHHGRPRVEPLELSGGLR